MFPGKSMDNANFMNDLLTKLDRLESQSGDATKQYQQDEPIQLHKLSNNWEGATRLVAVEYIASYCEHAFKS